MQIGRSLLWWMAVANLGLFSQAWAQPPAAAEPWHLLEPPGEGFRLELPGKPETQAGELDTPAGKIQVRSYLLTDAKRNRSYQAAANRLPAPSTDLEALLNRTRDGVVRSVQGKLLNELKLSFDRHAGRALTVDAGDGRFVHVRLFAAGDRLYQINIIADSAQPTADDQRVLSSFEFREITPVAEVKPDWRFVNPRNEKLAIEMPADPQETSGVLDTPLGRVKLTRLECQSSGRTYFVQICDWPASLAGDAAARLDAAREHALQSVGGKLIEEAPLTVSDRSGRAAVIAVKDRMLRLRTFVDGPRVYQLGTIAAAAELSDDEKKFLESLKLPTAQK